MLAMQWTILFMAIAIPIMGGYLDFAATLSLDSAAKKRTLERQYAESSCLSFELADGRQRVFEGSMEPGSVETNGYTLTYDETGCRLQEVE
jgi:hypothetical protein